MERNRARAYTEVYELLKTLPEYEYSKIPKEEIAFYEENRDKKYIFNIDVNAELKKQNISREANAIIISLYKKYFANENEIKQLNTLLTHNQIKIEEIKKNFNYENILKKEGTDVTEKLKLPIEKEKTSFLKKLKEFIIKFFIKITRRNKNER